MSRVSENACLRSCCKCFARSVIMDRPADSLVDNSAQQRVVTCSRKLSIIAGYSTLIGRRRGSDGRRREHKWAVINRRPGACLLVAADFLVGAARPRAPARPPAAPSGDNPPRLSRDLKRVRGDQNTDRACVQGMHAVRLLSIELGRVGLWTA